ncbi:MAG: glycosyltransferase [Chlamydiae bacterium]|nr:glycosyltransferase [Chlamydiota bacterium]
MLRLFLIVFFPYLSAQAKPLLCLNMIVKNEKRVIERALHSAMPWIDYWVIVDTGSTDGTQELIKQTLHAIPGELYERPWKNFGFNRTEALELAKDKADYIIFLDADDYFEWHPEFAISMLDRDAYYLTVNNKAKTFSYLRPNIIKTDLPWKWVGVTHEYLACEATCSSSYLEGILYILGGDGARSQDSCKYLKVAEELERGLQEEPENARYQFYLAESYRDAGLLERLLEAYRKRVAMGGWAEEVFWSLFQMAELQQRLHYPMEEVLQRYYAQGTSRVGRRSLDRSEFVSYTAS